MRKVRGSWVPNKAEMVKYIKVLMSKGYDNSEAIDIIQKRLFEYNPLGMSMNDLINRTIAKNEF